MWRYAESGVSAQGLANLRAGHLLAQFGEAEQTPELLAQAEAALAAASTLFAWLVQRPDAPFHPDDRPIVKLEGQPLAVTVTLTVTRDAHRERLRRDEQAAADAAEQARARVA